METQIYPTVHCGWCGNYDVASYVEDTKNAMVELEACFSCYHWIGQMQIPGGIVINGGHYRIGSSTVMRGFGGATFHIRYFDGTCLTTNNLWYQGPIPEHFRGLLPDNAKFTTSDFEFEVAAPF